MQITIEGHELTPDEHRALMDALDVFGRLMVCDFHSVGHILKLHFKGKLGDDQLTRIVEVFTAAHDAIHDSRSKCLSIFHERVPVMGLHALRVEQLLLDNPGVARGFIERIQEETHENYFVGYDEERDGAG